MPSSQPLPPKEKNLFNRILKCYEQKQHRNGLKFAKQILSNPKFAEHGETLAMKGLTLSCTGKKEEAYELVKRGLKNDLKSHVCWHVYGLLQRSDKKYDEAIKCYRNALRWDKDNLHILRDLSMLQVHLRDLEGYRETRYKLLQLKPGQRASWIGYAISNHLLKDYMVAYKVLEEFFKVQQSQDAAYEMSELLLFQNAILREAGRYQQALDHLKDNEERIVDKLLLMESKGELLLSLGRLEEAEEIFTSLIYRNPENHKYFDNLERVIKPQNFEERLQIYQAVLNIFPKADSPKLIPLTFSKGEDFRTLLSKLMREQLKRGVPPLFVSLKPLYKDPDKVRIIGELVSQFIIHLKSISKFSPEDEQEEPPTTFLWARYFMAQHLTALHEYERALKMVNESLEHTPTLIELHVLKAKVLKHMGDTEGAMQSMDEAQSLDTADRYINCKCVAYMIRNDMLVEAEETVAKFTRENVSVIDYLREMQCMWYEVDFAAAHWRAQRYGKALQKCHEVDKHFTDIIDDQFDFHQYCMRKITLRSYVNMLKLEDGLRSHEFYFQAARIAIQVYLRLHDQPYKSEGGESSDQDSSVSGAELKKLRNKQRRQERKKAAAEEKRKQELEKSRKKRQQNKNEDEADTKKLVVFDPEKLASVADPLEQANRFLAPLQLFCAQRFDTHLFAFRIAQRRSKLLLMLRSLLRCQELADERQLPELHFCKVQFAKKVRNANGVASAVNDVIQQFMHQLFDGLDLEEFNSRFLDKNRDSLPHLFAGCRGMYHLDNGKRDEVVNMLLNVSLNTKNINLKACESVYLSLRNNDMGVLPGPTLEALREKFHQFHPRACVFMLQPEGKTSAQEAKKTPMSNGIEKHDVESAGDNDQKKISQKELKPIDHASEPSALVENHCSHGD